MGRFQSSEAKDLVRERYDLPLVQAVYRRKRGPIRYFGLPGEQALDLKSWGHLCEYVAAVELFPESFQRLQHVLNVEYGHLRHRAHLGDVDHVILMNKGRDPSARYVSTKFRSGVGFTWDFDVIYLDYFGKFLPYGRGGREVFDRTRALVGLFNHDRQDAWQPWLLILTVESRYGPEDRYAMQEFLSETKEEADEVKEAINYLLSGPVSRREEAARLVHGTLSYLIGRAAASSGVRVRPRPTVVYPGWKGIPMLHFAYEMNPVGRPLQPSSVLSLLKSPLLQVRDDLAEPWFKMLPSQPPGQSEEELRAALDFLDNEQVDQII